MKAKIQNSPINFTLSAEPVKMEKSDSDSVEWLNRNRCVKTKQGQYRYFLFSTT